MKLRNVLAHAFVISSFVVSTAYADTVVKVTLIDKMGTPDLSKPLGLGMGLKAHMSTAKMAININPKVPAPGHVRFDVTKLASNLVHEVIVSKITDRNGEEC